MIKFKLPFLIKYCFSGTYTHNFITVGCCIMIIMNFPQNKDYGQTHLFKDQRSTQLKR